MPPIPKKKLMEKTNEQLVNKRIRYLQVKFRQLTQYYFRNS